MSLQVPHKSTSPPINVWLYRAATIGDVDLFKQTLEDASICEQLSHMESPQENSVLHLAASFGHAAIVELIIPKCPSLVTKINSKGHTALHSAAKYGHLSVVRFLAHHANAPIDIETGESKEVGGLLRMKNVDGNTALHEALKHGHKMVAHELIMGDIGLLSTVNNKGESSFYLAAEVGLHELVELLLNLPNDHLLHERQEGKTALHVAIQRKHIGTVELLVKEKPELVKLRDAHGRSALHYAIASGSLQAVRCLLKSDTSVAHQQGCDGAFPIHFAASKGRIDLIQEILYHCPDSGELLDHGHRNALHVAIKCRQENTVKYMMRTPELEKLINERDADGNTPLHIATIEARVIIVSILVQDKRVDISAVNDEGLTPYETADKYAAAKSSFQKDRKILTCATHSSRCDAWKLSKENEIFIKRVRDFGFESIGRYTHRNVDHALLTVLVERWQPETYTFHFWLGEMTITLDDVKQILGVLIEGDAVVAKETILLKSIQQESGWLNILVWMKKRLKTCLRIISSFCR